MARTHAAPLAARSTTRPAERARSPRAWAWAGLLLGLLATLAHQAPAHWLAQALAQASGGRIHLVQARGTVWNGSAQWVLRGGAASQDRAALPGRVNWRLQPHWQGLSVQLQSDCCAPQALRLHLSPRWGGAQLRVDDGDSHWPAQVLTGLGTPWNTVQAQGQLHLRTRNLHLQWAQGRVQWHGQVQLDALAMSSRLSTLQPMGSYRLLLQGAEPGATASAPSLTLTTLQGQLLLSGQGQWVGPRLRFRGEAQAAPGAEQALANLLNIIGRRDGARSLISLG